MKTNLDKFFKTDTELEESGIWFDISEDVGFLVRRMAPGNVRNKQALAKHFKPYAAQINNGTLDQKKMAEIFTRIFVETCLVDWKGVEIDGKPVEFDQETAVKFFIALPELTDQLRSYAEDSKNYLEELGNS